VAVASSAELYANHLHLTPDRYLCQHLTSQFLQADALPAAQPTASKHRRDLF